MTQPQGPGSPYQLLFSDETAETPSLPEAFRQIYPGDWHVPALQDRPYIYSNFAQSRDGRISFNEPGAESAEPVTKANPHDRWLMGLLRVRADAILVGDVTVNKESGHIWTPEFIYPPDAEAFAALRAVEGYRPVPRLVSLSLDGKVNFDEATFQRNDVHIILATTAKGAAQASDVQRAATIDVHNLGDLTVDLQRLMRLLRSDYGITNLLCEGGARVFANLLDAGLIDEEFVTYCPTFVGRSPDRFRPSYCEGVAWQPETAPYSKPLSLHRAGDLLFMRTQCQYQT
jgi:5-amino-6-(5-phosphoribosylamino)uracil reductase